MLIEDLMRKAPESVTTAAPVVEARGVLWRRGVFVDYDDDVEEAAALMRELDLEELPVVGATAELVGFLRRTDVLPLTRLQSARTLL